MMLECRYYPECEYARGCDGSKSCEAYKPMPDVKALAMLADELDEVAQRRRSMGYDGFAIGDEDRARRIREAIGVES